MGRLEGLCLRSHPDAYFDWGQETLVWSGKRYPGLMLICARKEPDKSPESDTGKAPNPGPPKALT